MRIALVHDYLNEFGGAERVLLALSEMYPDAPIYTIYCKKDSPAGREFKDKNVMESWFSWLPYSHKLISPFRFLIPFIWATFDFSDYDLVITSASWAVTKGMKRGERTREICYLHTPPRYLYGYDTSRDWSNEWFSGLVKIYAAFVNRFMRFYDQNQANKVDLFIANSKNVGKRIEKFYKITSYEVVYPPIDLKKFNDPKINFEKGEYYLTGGRLVAAKNFNLIIKACKEANVKLKIFGTGILEDDLKAIANENVEFLGRISDEKLVALYKGAKAFIAAGKDEDFGITLVETAAAGCPSIAYKAEGYIETVVDGKTGIFFEDLTSDSISMGIKKFEKTKWNKSEIKKHAGKFSKERFEKEVRQIVKEVVE